LKCSDALSICMGVLVRLQLFATGRLIRWMGQPVALAALPVTAGLTMAAIALQPVPATVALAEVVRKVVAYGVARPSREILFTVVSREDKYKSKVRLGDRIPCIAAKRDPYVLLCVPVGLCCILFAGYS
jgi:ATP/ADP translocase